MSSTKGNWTRSSIQVFSQSSKSRYGPSRVLRERAKKFVFTRELPENPFGKWTKSRLQPDTEFANDIKTHLLSCGKYIAAKDIVNYLNDPEVQRTHGLKKSISAATSKRWMHKLGYRFVRNHRGQYVDGHERDDVVCYRQSIFLPKWYSFEERMRAYGNESSDESIPHNPSQRPVVVWFHDESIFYAHDRRKSRWVAQDESPTPYAKGEGHSLMVADFVSADYGWLRSKDGKRSARVIFRPGKNRDGYFDNDDIIKQAEVAIEILKTDYPDEDHVFVYDNATTHMKRPPEAPSAKKMPKNTPKDMLHNWGVEVTSKDSNGRTIFRPDGKPWKERVPMGPGKFKDGTSQSFYFPVGHPKAGLFKGMAEILKERGYGDWSKVRYECKGFHCDPALKGDCCCRQKLFNEPDFTNGKSYLELACEKAGFQVLFLPKFHCELNFIEQCWGRAKWHYRLLPESSKEEDLERNMIQSLEMIEIEEIRRFARRSRRFMDGYHKGLDGKAAAWASKKYRGHRVLPDTILQMYNDENHG
ncbi:hypothetical protein K435DRAFT_654565 [Dendrothele bispora CBS 962.96]|uniref:Tc1-like transposase DDE domain-containing protein n=1 Tax=Dendrothele bispora (strain CBS 962.96) TaxID=1314807 RepID=A0A4S8MHN6_DENBC|nr:hypothetical protein K435DRAFT_654565 [Dendrothele bispora CBS 962.96]